MTKEKGMFISLVEISDSFSTHRVQSLLVSANKCAAEISPAIGPLP